MKNRRFAFLLCLSLIFSVLSPLATFASSPETSAPVIEEPEPDPYFYIDSIFITFRINSSGKSTDYCSAYIPDTSRNYTLTMRLQKQNSDGTWNTANPVKTWSTSGNDTVYLDKEWYVLHGTYRLSVTIDVYNAQGLLCESVTEYSHTVTY